MKVEFVVPPPAPTPPNLVVITMTEEEARAIVIHYRAAHASPGALTFYNIHRKLEEMFP